MKVKELEEKLSITRSQIRFYEKEGLLTPQRNENGYREYDVKDEDILKKIILFRKLGFSIEMIDQIFNHELTINQAVEDHITSLHQQINSLNGAINVCNALNNEDISIDTFDIDYYYELVDEQERKGNKFLDLYNDYIDVETEVTKKQFYYLNITKSKTLNIIISLIVACIVYEILYFTMSKLFHTSNDMHGAVIVITTFIILTIAYLPGMKKVNDELEWTKYKKKADRWIFGIAGGLMVLLVIIVLWVIFF